MTGSRGRTPGACCSGSAPSWRRGPKRKEEKRKKKKKKREGGGGEERSESKIDLALVYAPLASIAVALLLHACHALVKPPTALPWLWDAAITGYCSLFFAAAFAYLNLRMWFGLEGEIQEEQDGGKATSTSKTLRPRRAGPARAKRD